MVTMYLRRCVCITWMQDIKKARALYICSDRLTPHKTLTACYTNIDVFPYSFRCTSSTFLKYKILKWKTSEIYLECILENLDACVGNKFRGILGGVDGKYIHFCYFRLGQNLSLTILTIVRKNSSPSTSETELYSTFGLNNDYNNTW